MVLAFTASTVAAPTTSAQESKPFKFQLKIEENSKEKVKAQVLYLTSTGGSTKNKAEGVTCSIAFEKKDSGAITCGASKGGLGSAMHSKLVPSPMAVNNKGWEIGANNEIFYKPSGGKPFHLTVMKTTNDIWAENCDNHPDKNAYIKGSAFAVYE